MGREGEKGELQEERPPGARVVLATPAGTTGAATLGGRLLVQDDAGEGPTGALKEHPGRVRSEVPDVAERRARCN
jgi:hypothetical protein